MPDARSSFIPKRNPVKKSRTAVSRRVYTFTVVSYVFLFAALLSAGGAFLYSQFIERQLENELASLNAEIARFNEADMLAVKAFDARLQNVTNRVERSVSVASLFTALEAATLGAVTLEGLALARNGDESVTVESKLVTDTFDAALFQRSVYEQNAVVGNVAVSDVLYGEAVAGTGDDESVFTNAASDSDVSLEAVFEITLDQIPFVPPSRQVAPVEVPQPVSAPSPATSTVATSTNLSS